MHRFFAKVGFDGASRARSCRRMLAVVVCLLLAGLLPACRAEEKKAEPLQPVVKVEPLSTTELLQAPVALTTVEVATELLAVWRKVAPGKPNLLLLSAEPMLIAPPAAVRQELENLLPVAEQQQWARYGSSRYPDPVVLPTMTLGIALSKGWFGHLYWVLPVVDDTAPLNVELFKQEMAKTNVLSSDELESFAVNAHGAIEGTLRGVPVTVTTLANLQEIAGATALYIDQSWLQQSYKNEIATPLFPLVYKMLKTLRQEKLAVAEVSFCFGNQEERISLQVRFVGEVLKAIFEKPELLDLPLEGNWRRQADILYLENFFEKQRVFQLAEAMVESAPESAWTHYAKYQAAATNRDGELALASLGKAVSIDPLYALEYVSLMQMALEKQRPGEAMRMISLACAALPEDFVLKITKLELAIKLGDREAAMEMLEDLNRLAWSPVYFSALKNQLDEYAEHLKQPTR